MGAGSLYTVVMGHASARHDEIVIHELLAAAFNELSLEVDPFNLGAEVSGVPESAQQRTHGIGYLLRFDFGRRDLVQERQKGVVVVPVNDGDPDRSPGQVLQGPQACEACADYYDFF